MDNDPKLIMVDQSVRADEPSVFQDDEFSQSNNNLEDLKDESPRRAKDDHIAKTESRIVFLVRILVVFLLLAVTAGVSVGVYYFVSNAETESFEEDYNDSSEKVLDSVGNTMDQSLGAIDNLMVGIVSHQASNGMKWPFVTVPNFATRASKILALGRASVIGFYPKVMNADREEWEKNYTLANDAWVDESLRVQREDPTFKGTNLPEWQPFPFIHSVSGILPEREKYYPTWQAAPIVPRYGAYNWDLYFFYSGELEVLEKERKVIMGRTLNLPEADHESIVPWIQELIGPDLNPEEPLFPFYYPIIENAVDAVNAAELEPSKHKVVGVIAMTLFWREIIKKILSPGSLGMIVVFGNDCDQSFTYQINGPDVVYLGNGDLHSSEYDNMVRFSYLHKLTRALAENQAYTGFPLSETYCPYWIKTYPSDTMKDEHETNNPLIFTIVAVSIFVFTAAFFLVYDCVSERRQKKVLRIAVQSSAVVSSLFPQVVRDRIFPSQQRQKPKERIETAKLRLQQFLNKDGDDDDEHVEVRESQLGADNAPIADLFSDTTVMFLDIAGFTAWSSMREPQQVFTLLETLYSAYDTLAARRGVFKVETIGDSYVAACGLPDPRPDHALVMIKFARDVREKTNELVKKLTNTLGPDTGDLEVRIGLNSGPVTAGVLRGERSRFQLFGDTVNTAARMESTGVVSKIQVTQSTASLIRQAGKSHWIHERVGGVQAKGKGTLQTFFVEPTIRQSSSTGDVDVGIDTLNVLDDKTRRLVGWNVEILSRLVRQIVSRREARKILGRKTSKKRKQEPTSTIVKASVKTGTVLEEVTEVIMLPEFDPALVKNTQDSKDVELSDTVTTQLEEYVAAVASMYKDNPFHNFEHASHVTMSVVKLLSRIVAPTDNVIQAAEETNGPLESTLHDHSYGITSDPLTQFSCVFSALIHDVDHPGVPNTTLVKEGSALVSVYKGKSVAEQNSVDLSWHLLMQEQFVDLRAAICATQSEMDRFRQLVVNAVMATDIMDKDLKNQRNARWEKAFSEASLLGENEAVTTNRKATIVIEHLLQASDVAHTMQHWHIFRKWNERLFSEMYAAFQAGRSDKNPATFWFKGELGFFDFYIIPLAKKLSDCGVFGVASDEYLGYALKNREEWEAKGREVVESMVAKFGVSIEAAAECKRGEANTENSPASGDPTDGETESSSGGSASAEETRDGVSGGRAPGQPVDLLSMEVS